MEKVTSFSSKTEQKKFDILNYKYRESKLNYLEFMRKVLTKWVRKCGGELMFPSMYYNDFEFEYDGENVVMSGLEVEGDNLSLKIEGGVSIPWIFVEECDYVSDVVMNIYFGGKPLMYNENQCECYQD